jgi:hypothetical protein
MRVHVAAFATLLPLALTGAGSATAANAGAAPNAAAAKCSEATLSGTYQFANEGFAVSGKVQGPFANAGQEVYDGRGNVRAVSTFSTNGKITRFDHTTGKYTVKPDCTGSVSYADGTRYDQFVAPDGSQLVFVETNPGTVAAGFEPRVTARRVGD